MKVDNKDSDFNSILHISNQYNDFSKIKEGKLLLVEGKTPADFRISTTATGNDSFYEVVGQTFETTFWHSGKSTNQKKNLEYVQEIRAYTVERLKEIETHLQTVEDPKLTLIYLNILVQLKDAIVSGQIGLARLAMKEGSEISEEQEPQEIVELSLVNNIIEQTVKKMVDSLIKELNVLHSKVVKRESAVYVYAIPTVLGECAKVSRMVGYVRELSGVNVEDENVREICLEGVKEAAEILKGTEKVRQELSDQFPIVQLLHEWIETEKSLTLATERWTPIFTHDEFLNLFEEADRDEVTAELNQATQITSQSMLAGDAIGKIWDDLGDLELDDPNTRVTILSNFAERLKHPDYWRYLKALKDGMLLSKKWEVLLERNDSKKIEKWLKTNGFESVSIEDDANIAIRFAQRLPRISMMMRELIKATSEMSAVNTELEILSTAIEYFTLLGNESIRGYEQKLLVK